MKRPSPLLPRLAALGVSCAVCGAALFLYLRGRGGGPPPVVVVDGAERMERLFAERDSGAAWGSEPGADGDGDEGGVPRLVARHALDRETILAFFPTAGGRGWTVDPPLYFRRDSNVKMLMRFGEHPDTRWRIVTNAAGFLSDDELLERPDLRVLVTGDSHVDGMVPNAENLTQVLARGLRAARPGSAVEVLNAGVGTYNLYCYLVAVEERLALRPDVVVVVVYGGNDFAGSMSQYRYFNCLNVPTLSLYAPHEVQETLPEDAVPRGVVPQELGQAAYFLNVPEDVETALELGRDVARELRLACDAAGAELVFAYLPPPMSGQPHWFRFAFEPLVRDLGLPDHALEISDALADRWLAQLAADGIAAIDLRPLLRAEPQTAYWWTDQHIDVVGHRVVGEALLPLVLERWR